MIYFSIPCFLIAAICSWKNGCGEVTSRRFTGLISLAHISINIEIREVINLVFSPEPPRFTAHYSSQLAERRDVEVLGLLVPQSGKNVMQRPQIDLEASSQRHGNRA